MRRKATTCDPLMQLVASVQQQRSERRDVQARVARSGMPRRLYEPLAAFASHLRKALQARNPPHLLLVDLDEKHAV
jgi:hypothetical protein